MDAKKFSAALALLLVGLFLTGCQKDSAQQKTAATGLAAGTGGSKADTNSVPRDLGTLMLTNHYETCVQLGAGKNCILTPKMIDRHNMQLTLAVESKTATGKMHDLSVTQVVTPAGKPVEVAVGDFSLSLTPNIAAE